VASGQQKSRFRSASSSTIPPIRKKNSPAAAVPAADASPRFQGLNWLSANVAFRPEPGKLGSALEVLQRKLRAPWKIRGQNNEGKSNSKIACARA